MATMVVLVYLLFGTYLWGDARKEVAVTCKDFHTQLDAQKRYESNPVKYANLNRKRNRMRDNLACNNLPKS